MWTRRAARCATFSSWVTTTQPCAPRVTTAMALSSRNVHLSPEERAAAPILRRALAAAVKAYDEGERAGTVLRGLMEEILAIEPLAQAEYVSVAGLIQVAFAGLLVGLGTRIGGGCTSSGGGGRPPITAAAITRNSSSENGFAR